jgi:uncharacterized MAPEG superfamily protein
LFIAAVLAAQQMQVAQPLIDKLALAFVVLRVAYIWLYVADLAMARTLVWSAGLAVSVALLLAPLWA